MMMVLHVLRLGNVCRSFVWMWIDGACGIRLLRLVQPKKDAAHTHTYIYIWIPKLCHIHIIEWQTVTHSPNNALLVALNQFCIYLVVQFMIVRCYNFNGLFVRANEWVSCGWAYGWAKGARSISLSLCLSPRDFRCYLCFPIAACHRWN